MVIVNRVCDCFRGENCNLWLQVKSSMVSDFINKVWSGFSNSRVEV